jgi:hypothetical protein
MNIFTNHSLKFQLEINKIRENDEALKLEVAEINRIAKESGVSAKYVRLNEDKYPYAR